MSESTKISNLVPLKRPFQSLRREAGRLCPMAAVDISETEKERRETPNKKYYRRERCFGSFERSFAVPDDIDADKVKTDFENGVVADHSAQACGPTG